MRFKDTVGLSYYVRKIELVLRKKIDEALKPLKITLPQYSVLAILEEEIKLTNAELARRASLTPQTMNKILHAMEQEKLLHPKMDKNNDLKIHYVLTPKALKLICSAHSIINQIELDMINGIPEKDFAHFQQILEKMHVNLNPMTPKK